jgi:phage terminase large subunit-like protein
MAAKEQPLFVMITTAGFDLNSICYEQHEYALKVRDGIIKDDRYLPVIYAASIEDDPFIEDTWKKANPNYGVSVKKDYIKEQAEKARQNKAYLNTFLRLHLNVWTDVKDIWIKDSDWQKCASNLSRDELYEILKGHKCTLAFDLGRSSDITSLTLMFPPDEDRDFEPYKYISLNWFWLPEEKGKDSADKNNNNYLQWVAEGHIFETEGNITDYAPIYDLCIQISRDFMLMQIAYDRALAVQLAANLEKELGAEMMFMHSQMQLPMTPPTTEFERIIVNSKTTQFLHDNNPVLRWMVANTILLIDSRGEKMNNPLVKPGKNKGSSGKIDGVVSNVMCLSYWLAGEDNSEGSYLDENDVIYVEL